MLSSIPSPPSEFVPGLGVRYYGLMIALGVFAAVTLARRRWKALGNDPDQIADVAVIAVPAGLIGARLYHVITDWNRLYSDGRWWPKAFQIWNGGLGIPGGIFLGAAAGLWAAKHYKLDVPALIDTMIPTIPLAQAIGRLGNWFNQELYGRPTTLPWGLEISPAKRPPQFANVETFHPTFLYEALWNLGIMGLMLWLDSKHIFKRGRMLPLYLFLYFFGRLWVESIRIDTATLVLGMRVNTLLSLTMIALSTVWFMWGGPLRPVGERGMPYAIATGVDPVDGEPVIEDQEQADSGERVLGEDGVADPGPEIDGPAAEVSVAQADDPEAGDGVDPHEGA